MRENFNFNDLRSAHDVLKVFRKVARDEVQKVRPAPSYATVTDINLEERYCMVLFPGGEAGVDDVRVVITHVIPSEIGQRVRIGGTTNDRYIEAIVGSSKNDTDISDLIARVEALEAIPAPGEYFFEVTSNRNDGLMTADPTEYQMPTVTDAGINGFEVQPNGSVACQQAGRYYLYAAWTFPTTGYTGGNDVWVEIRVYNSNNQIKKYLTGGDIDGLSTAQVSGMAWLDVGDRLQFTAWTGKWRSSANFMGSKYRRMGGFLVNTWQPAA